MSPQAPQSSTTNSGHVGTSEDAQAHGMHAQHGSSDEEKSSRKQNDSDDTVIASSHGSDYDSEDGTGSNESTSNEYGTSESWDEDECPPLDLNYDALKHVARYYLPGDMVAARSYHEVRQLRFEDGWSCIGRFTRDKLENFAVTESGYATIEYVRKHTSIPVPQIYFMNYDPANPVGAAFVLMERMPGHSLSKLWPMLSTTMRHDVLSQLAGVIIQLGQVKFDRIGSLTSSGLGPCQSVAVPDHQIGKGPFRNVADFMLGFLCDGSNPEMETLLRDIRKELVGYLDTLDLPSTEAPFRLIHGDLDLQNLLFTWESPDTLPMLSAVIDWDYSWVGPAYYLYEYPPMVLDQDSADHEYTENKELRKRIVQTLAQRFPKGRLREEVKQSFRDKTFVVTYFRTYFVGQRWGDADMQLRIKRHFLERLKIAKYGLRDGQEAWHAYNGRPDWEPHSELD